MTYNVSSNQATAAAEKLKKAGYRLHHTAAARGYVSRRGGGVITDYNGRFGAGYIWSRPRWDTSQYVTIEYWTR